MERFVSAPCKCEDIVRDRGGSTWYTPMSLRLYCCAPPPTHTPNPDPDPDADPECKTERGTL